MFKYGLSSPRYHHIYCFFNSVVSGLDLQVVSCYNFFKRTTLSSLESSCCITIHCTLLIISDQMDPVKVNICRQLFLCGSQISD